MRERDTEQAELIAARAVDFGNRRRELMADLDDVHGEVAALVPAAQEAGLPVTHLAALVGITPQALYALVRRRNRRADT